MPYTVVFPNVRWPKDRSKARPAYLLCLVEALRDGSKVRPEFWLCTVEASIFSVVNLLIEQRARERVEGNRSVFSVICNLTIYFNNNEWSSDSVRELASLFPALNSPGGLAWGLKVTANLIHCRL